MFKFSLARAAVWFVQIKYICRMNEMNIAPFTRRGKGHSASIKNKRSLFARTDNCANESLGKTPFVVQTCKISEYIKRIWPRDDIGILAHW